MIKIANIKCFDQFYEGYILIESVSDLENFRKEKQNGMIRDSAISLMERKTNISNGGINNHSLDALVITSEETSKITGAGILRSHSDIVGDMRATQAIIISSGKKIAINPFNLIGYFPVPKDAEIEIITDKITYELNDIKIFKWERGSHFYAKVGQIDVVVDGEQKWNAKWIAQNKAEEFLSSLNSRNG